MRPGPCRLALPHRQVRSVGADQLVSCQGAHGRGGAARGACSRIVIYVENQLTDVRPNPCDEIVDMSRRCDRNSVSVPRQSSCVLLIGTMFDATSIKRFGPGGRDKGGRRGRCIKRSRKFTTIFRCPLASSTTPVLCCVSSVRAFAPFPQRGLALSGAWRQCQWWRHWHRQRSPTTAAGAPSCEALDVLRRRGCTAGVRLTSLCQCSVGGDGSPCKTRGHPKTEI